MQGFVNTTIQRYGGVDIFLANAGIEGEIHSIVETPVEMFDRVMSVNVRGVWLGLKYVMPVMNERGGGSIVITSSTAGRIGSAGMAPYSRYGEPEEVARLMLFLASDESSYCNGGVYMVDGGTTAGRV